MNDSILVDFHCHSIFSDGEQTPEALAASLASAGVRYASLTDHDSIEGLPRFEEALKKRGVSCLSGVELTTQFNGRELHLLAYGFDPEHPDLATTLRSLRQVQEKEVRSIAGSLRKKGSGHAGVEGVPAVSAAPDGQLDTGDAIELIHQRRRAGYFGRIRWCMNPTCSVWNLDVVELKSLGLDGLEAIYAPFTVEQRNSLMEIAQRQELLISAGTDIHMGGESGAIEMPREDWIRFREAMFAGHAFAEETPGFGKAVPSNPAARYPIGKSGFHATLLRIARLPAHADRHRPVPGSHLGRHPAVLRADPARA